MRDYILTSNGELYHYGVKGMKWGVRRYTNDDGSLTDAGQKRFVNSIQKMAKSRSARKDMVNITANKIKEELDREISFKDTAKKLRGMTSDFEKLVNEAYNTNNARKRNSLYDKAEKVFNNYTTERNRAVDSLLGQYANTSIKNISRNTRQISDAKLITTFAIDDLSNWRYRGLS